MDFRISDTFTTSLGRLSGEEQKAVKTTAFDLQVDPSGSGMQFHRLDKARDRNFWSVRVSRDVRLIVHRTAGSLLLCYVGHHDDAYQWAERRRLEVHPRTGAAQFVEMRERVEEVVRRVEVAAPVGAAAKAPLFASVPIDDLMACGVPVEWVDEVRRTTEDSLLDLAEHLPAEAAEALLVLGTGGVPTALRADASAPGMAMEASTEYMARDASLQLPESAVPAGEPLDRAAFEHPDAQRRFRIVTNVEELERALDAPWDKWTVFLHPAQRATVERPYGGPARVSGSAGTGKTIVALHRAVFLARSRPEARVLLTTFSGPLANALRTKLRRLVGNEPRIAERLDLHAVDAIARRLYELNVGRPQMASRAVVRDAIRTAAGDGLERPLTLRFLTTEWDEVVDAWHIDSWEAYRDVARLGRKIRLPEKQRRVAWGVFEKVRASLAAQGVVTQSDLLSRLAGLIPTLRQPPFDHVVVDEAQDLSVAQLRFLAALGGGRPDALFFAGDLGQRIFQLPFSWKALGVDVRGRSRTLRVNYRTSHQIRTSADRLLGPEVADVDGNKEDRRGTVSVFNGPEPLLGVFDGQQLERDAVAQWLSLRSGDGVKPHEIAVFVRSAEQIPRAIAAVADAGLSYRELDEKVETVSGSVSISTMHLAKGLEFRAVAVMACDDKVLPLKERIESVADDSDLQEVYDTERHLLYVACTRARDCLMVTGVVPASEYLDDLKP